MKLFALIYTMVDIELSNRHRPEHVAFLADLVRSGKIECGWKFPHYEPGALQAHYPTKCFLHEQIPVWRLPIGSRGGARPGWAEGPLLRRGLSPPPARRPQQRQAPGAYLGAALSGGNVP